MDGDWRDLEDYSEIDHHQTMKSLEMSYEW